MSDQGEPAAIIDLQTQRKARQHELHEARLLKVRAAFEKALPLTSGKSSKTRAKKKKPKR